MQRYLALDFIRGCAILGILLLNIVGFGLPSAAYLNPAWHNSISVAEIWTWGLLDAFAQLKFLTLFALLFGAGLQLCQYRSNSDPPCQSKTDPPPLNHSSVVAFVFFWS